MMASLMLLAWCLGLCFSEDVQNYCKVSSLIDKQQDHLLPYPIFYEAALLAPSELIADASLVPASSKTYECDIRREVEENYRGNRNLWGTRINDQVRGVCVPNICPVDHRALNLSWSALNWPYRADAVCALAKNRDVGDVGNRAIRRTPARDRHDKRTRRRTQGQEKGHRPQRHTQTQARVNVVVFGGSMTRGEDILLDCVQPDHHSVYPANLVQLSYAPERPLCPWFARLMGWMAHTFGADHDLRFYNLAIGGTSSMEMSEEVQISLLSAGITLSGSDIVFLDHSCNEQNGIGLEPLIRNIYREVATVADRPSIIVMEQYWTGKYAEDYRKIAEYYHLPIFSHRNVVRELGGNGFGAQGEELVQREQGMHGTEAQRVREQGMARVFGMYQEYQLHVPWHAHLYIADLLALYLSDMMDRCSLRSPSPNNPFPKAVMIPHPPSDASPSEGALPKPLYNLRTYGFTCKVMLPQDTESPFLLLSRANATLTPANLEKFESTLTTWTEYVDYHHSSGWIMNSAQTSSGRDRTLSFPLEKPLPRWDEAAPPRLGLRVVYLQTYRNAGVFDILFCGNKVARVDVMVGSQFNLLVSIPRTFHYKLEREDLQHCQNLHGVAPSVSLLHDGRVYDRASTRFDCKVKIMQVSVCVLQE
ncbi:hypothetical protein B484DRAFT_444282 [Ochromonadaceae sp. CCMP2298]|nr:hypothetical protein B484DRAFT_444282 [Ochromonadaceae sp. CCMP2298]|mmetsp:Transcript_11834/g.25913  ORF Transcript_11834/g.25913 Transcript_11834/m.25913 type:complete len:648 (-) Transcript_11834:107-2050(-)